MFSESGTTGTLLGKLTKDGMGVGEEQRCGAGEDSGSGQPRRCGEAVSTGQDDQLDPLLQLGGHRVPILKAQEVPISIPEGETVG